MKDYDQNKYLRTYRQRHPEKVKRWRLNQYAKYLIQEGWKVIPPNDEAKKNENDAQSVNFFIGGFFCIWGISGIFGDS